MRTFDPAIGPTSEYIIHRDARPPLAIREMSSSFLIEDAAFFAGSGEAAIGTRAKPLQRRNGSPFSESNGREFLKALHLPRDVGRFLFLFTMQKPWR
jgi:hypothetical protein